MQGTLFSKRSSTEGINGTFVPNYKTSVHRWFPYIEGFSADFVQSLLDEFGKRHCRIYDPFAGTGTTVTVAAANGALAFYSEVNPLMRLVIDCKTNSLRNVANRHADLAKYFGAIRRKVANSLPSLEDAQTEQSEAFGSRKYFAGKRLIEIVAAKRAVDTVPAPAPAFQNMARLALAAIAVNCSEMKRAADLRYRTSKEAHPEDFSALAVFDDKLSHILDDVDETYSELPTATCLSESCLELSNNENNIDLLITSPPYLNGTNYFRNTKLELWLTGLLESEDELGAHRTKALAAGINNISSRGRKPDRYDFVEKIASQLDEATYDQRIPELVRRYFSDSKVWLTNSFRVIRPGGTAVIDIGDSRFAGVHVPTDKLLAKIAESCGFVLSETRPVRKRKSKDGSPLQQVLLVLKKTRNKNKKPQNKTTTSSIYTDKSKDFLNQAIRFGQELPHLTVPYSARNWGHPLHSLCSYQGKLKPAIAHFLIERFTSPGNRVLDPLSGCGTLPLEAFLQERIPIGNDLQELAFILTYAKTDWGNVDEVFEIQQQLLNYVKKESAHQSVESYCEFGLNGKLPDYFHPDTFREILAAREYVKKNPCKGWGQAIVYSCLLHILHGNRPYALSRQSHPVTPFKPSGEIAYRPLAPRLQDKVNRTLSVKIPTKVRKGNASKQSYTKLRFRHTIDCVITSPPFAASTRFFSSNWMRLWFAGWEPNDFKERQGDFLERQQKQSLDIYEIFFKKCKNWLRADGRLIMHVGKTSKCDMGRELSHIASQWFDCVYSFDENVAGREKFGIRDQGATTSHQYLFMQPK